MVRPNTNVPDSYLMKKMLLCAGEDPAEVLQTVELLVGERPFREHSFRCYRFWQFSTFTLAWTGIGTGCVEPLLHEILDDSSVIEEMILIGTAGNIGGNENELGQPYVLRQAFLGPTAYLALQEGEGLVLEHGEGPWQPSWQVDGRSKAIISTDLFYDYDPQTNKHECDLVDMEVAQFYLLCSTLKRPRLKYVAIKGPANVVGEGGQQLANAQSVIGQCARWALELLDVSCAESNPEREMSNVDRPGEAAPSKDKLMDKLMEEVKLYWTIQIGIVGVLGLLLSKADPTNPIATATVAAVSLLLVLIGAVTNPAGNYYTFQSRRRLEMDIAQEGVISSTVEIIYIFLTGICGAIFCWAVNELLPDWAKLFTLETPGLMAAVFGFLVGGVANFLITWSVFSSLAKSDRAYRNYVRQKWMGGYIFIRDETT